MKMDKLESLFYQFKAMELKEEKLRNLQGGTNNSATTSAPSEGDTCGGNPCCTETAQEDCCTNQDTGNLPLGDCDPNGEIGDFCS